MIRYEKDKRRKLVKALQKEYVKGLHQLGEETAALAQKLVPVVTGRLKKSFEVRTTSAGVEFRYTAPYAWDVHEGTNIDKLDAPWVSSIPQHKRRLKSGKVVTVRKHTKTYKEGYKPIPVTKGWAALNINKMNRIPNRWLQLAWRVIYNKQNIVTKKMLPKELILSNE